MTGPYSAIFDWKKEQQDLETMQNKRQSAQQKIIRTNAIGDAFRLLIEGVGAATGATVVPRNVNPGILKALSDYSKNETEYMQRLEGIKTRKLALSQADVQYGLAQDAATLLKAEKREEESRQESRQAEKELDNYIRELRLQENQYRLRGLENEAEGVRKKIQMGEQAMIEVSVARKKAQFERGIDLVPGQGLSTGIDITTKPAKGDKTSMEFITPDTHQTIYLTPGLVNYISTQLSTGKSQYDQTIPKVLREIMANKNPQPEALAKAFTDNWDYIRDNIFAPVPDLAKQIGLKPGQETTQTGEQTVQQPVTAIEELQQKIWDNLNTDTTLNLEDNKKVKSKIIELSDMIYAYYLTDKGNKKTKNDAITEANKIVSRYRELQKGK
jgi:hypothetical protein